MRVAKIAPPITSEAHPAVTKALFIKLGKKIIYLIIYI